MQEKRQFGWYGFAHAVHANTRKLGRSVALTFLLAALGSEAAHDRQFDKKWIAGTDFVQFRGTYWPPSRVEGASIYDLDSQFTSITLDYYTGSAWGFRYPNLVKFEKFGFRTLETDVSGALTTSACFLSPTIALASPIPQLVSDDLSGNLWMAVGPGLYRFTSSGEFQDAIQAIGTCAQDKPIVGIALDTRRSRLWVLRHDTITVLDADGNKIRQTSLAGGGKLTRGVDIEYDAAKDEMWVALGDRANAYVALTGALAVSKTGTFSGQISPDGAGGIWAVAGAVRRANTANATTAQVPVNDPGMLIHVPRSGAVLQVEPFKASTPDTCVATGCANPSGPSYDTEAILDLAADRADASVWVISAASLKNISPSGYVTAHYSSPTGATDLGTFAPFLKLGFWADWEPPLFVLEAPATNSYFKGDSTLRASYHDDGWGFGSSIAVCPSTIRFSVVPATGLSVTSPTCTYQQKLTATLKSTGADGTYNVTATIDDVVGNRSAPIQFSVTIDRVSPDLTISSPADNAWVTRSPVVVNGSVNEIVTLSSGASSQAAYSSFAFPIDLYAEGARVLRIVATDRAGNSTTKNLTVRYDPTPPVVTITAPVTSGMWVATPTYAITGTISELANVTVNGTAVGSQVTAFTSARTLSVGGNTFTIVATDPAGNAAATTVVVNYDPDPPILDMARVNISRATDGTVTISGIAGSATAGTTVRVFNPRSGVTYTTTVATDGRFTLSFLGEICDRLQVWLTKSSGSEGRKFDTAVSRLQITQPADGSTVQSEFVTITGYFQAPAGSGIVVNNVASATTPNGSRVDFTVRVPLLVGSNTLNAVGSMPEGCVVTHQSTVLRSGTDPFVVDVDKDSGIAPLGVTFAATSPSQVAITSVRFDFDGNGTWDTMKASAPFMASYTYATVGLYKAKVGISSTGSAERFYEVPINVSSTNTIDATARALWSGLNAAISAGDNSGALAYIQPEVRDLYAQMFAYDVRPVLNELTDIQPLKITGSTAEYAVLRVHNGVVRSFVITFSQGADGVWRIESM